MSALTGSNKSGVILFVLHTSIQWEYLPQELGFGSGMTCWRCLAAWNGTGFRDRLLPVRL